eukprot:TRINITY_DN25444_c0_g1_i1.p1 TRINITY_DN25444_c0_g1~~TRINITY_DN25444_c0_g1_i1.p1  ORF type:complete len:698 (+),score=157.98 TRINITY_DN25444_c0_g1_i1:116-2209(+)
MRSCAAARVAAAAPSQAALVAALAVISAALGVAGASVRSTGTSASASDSSAANGASVSAASQLQQYVLPEGTRVRIKALQSAVDLNGAQAEVEGFDAASGRYVIQLPGQRELRKVRRENMEVLDAVQKRAEAMASFVQEMGAREAALKSQDTAPPWGEAPGGGRLLRPGTAVTLHGLHNAQELNGKVGKIRRFDFATNRYVVEVTGQQPRKLRRENLAVEAPRPPLLMDAQAPQPMPERLSAEHTAAPPDRPVVAAAASAPSATTSVCAGAREAPDAAGPINLPPGARATLHGLSSSAALQGGWNGMTVVVHCFDRVTGRYVVAMPDGLPRRILPDHLSTSGADSAVAAGAAAAERPPAALDGLAPPPSQLSAGIAAALLPPSQPVARRRGGDGRRVSPAALRGASAFSDNGDAPAAKAPVPRRPSAPSSLTVCNAYPQREPLRVFASPGRAGGRAQPVVKALDFQACTDLFDISLGGRVLSFVVGRYQVARLPLRVADFGPRRGVELTLHRTDPNSLRGFVRSDKVRFGSRKIYCLNVVNAYAGSKTLSLQVQRGNFAKELQTNQVFRLSIEDRMQLTLADGERRVQLGFQPRRGRGYSVIVTGADVGLRGEPREPGLVAHELGAWTASEELAPQSTRQAPADAEVDTAHDRGDGEPGDGDDDDDDESDDEEVAGLSPSSSFSFVGRLLAQIRSWI